MSQQYLFEPIPCDKYDLLTREDLVTLTKGHEDLLRQMQNYISELQAKLLHEEQKRFVLDEQIINIKHQLFGKSSEKSARSGIGKTSSQEKPGKKRVLLPSVRYPNLDIIEKEVTLDKLPACPNCQHEMKDSGLTENSEYLTVIPRRYYIVQQKRHKYCCPACHGPIVTAPAIPRITQGGSFSDELTIDVAMSKFLELMPVERYATAATREGVELKANSLIEQIHSLADFAGNAVVEKIKKEVFSSEIIHADETPHRMLEGDEKSRWYLWGFSTPTASYFEARDTRSGEVASDLLTSSSCRYLMSDVFSGYRRAVADANEARGGPPIINLYCNAHARRKFKEAAENFPESEFFLRVYRRIYRLQKERPLWRLKWQRLYMRAMLFKAKKLEQQMSTYSSLGKAINYFINNFEGFFAFTQREDLPIDNNAQERQLRSPVIGRKTWYGTHSPRGAKTVSIMFSIVESCKLNKINPREYLRDLVKAIHEGRAIFTPAEYFREKSA